MLFAGCQFASAQLRVLEGEFITLHTDLPASSENAQLPKAFDAAVPLWCKYFGISQTDLGDWHVTAHLLSTREAFDQRGLLPANIPNFAHGFQWGDRLWVVNQPSAYYTRHLLLHEGVHALMAKAYGGAGPAWFMEGTAELLATHKWNGTSIQTPVLPASRDEFPYWGRLKLIRQRRQEGTALSLESVMRYSSKAHRKVEPYAWSWAALTFMDMYPEYREVVIAHAPKGFGQSDAERMAFTRSFHASLREDWGDVRLRWQMFLHDVDYGFDHQSNRISLGTAESWDSTARELDVAANRGWQSSGILLSQGDEIEIQAAGRYSLGTLPKPWVCEPQGVSVRYYRGNPLGTVLAAISDPSHSGGNNVSSPQVVAVGRGKRLKARRDGLLLLRIGDDPGELSDNSGAAKIKIMPTDIAN